MIDTGAERISQIIMAAPDEWTPNFTRAELLPLAEALDENERLREALREMAASHGVECSFAHGVDCRGNTKLREKARNALEGGGN